VRTRDELLAVVSHDLRNPLSSILLETKTMLILTPDDEGKGPLRVLRECAEGIKGSATRMMSLTDELLDLASIERRRLQLHLQLVESRKLIDDALLTASPLAAAKRIAFAVELIDTPRVNADPDRIFRVLSNLLGNATKFTPEEGTITVRAERRGGDFSIAIADTGPGIAAEDLPHVFERHWKGASTTKSGSGLGLYIARGIVEAHGGKIWAESSAAGARFTFTLPLTH
jgi:signal transduction histidine kinase